MLTEFQAIRLILDAATKDDYKAATKALNDFADQKHQVNASHLVGDNLNSFGQQLMNMEEVRGSWPRVNTSTSPAMNALNQLP